MSSLEQAKVDGAAGGASASAGIELAEDRGDVGVHRQARGEPAQHVHLPVPR